MAARKRNFAGENRQSKNRLFNHRVVLFYFDKNNALFFQFQEIITASLLIAWILLEKAKVRPPLGQPVAHRLLSMPLYLAERMWNFIDQLIYSRD
jgi:hypothetical protein